MVLLLMGEILIELVSESNLNAVGVVRFLLSMDRASNG